jgi:hypothetical protein
VENPKGSFWSGAGPVAWPGVIQVMHFRNIFSTTLNGPAGEESYDDSDIENQIPPMDFAITSDRSPSPMTGDSMHDFLGSRGQSPGPSSRSVSPAPVPEYGGAFLGGGAMAEEIDDNEDEDEDEDEYDDFSGDAIPTTAEVLRAEHMMHHFRFSYETPVPYHPGFRVNDEDEDKKPDRSLQRIVTIAIPEEGTRMLPPRGDVVDLDEVHGRRPSLRPM